MRRGSPIFIKKYEGRDRKKRTPTYSSSRRGERHLAGLEVCQTVSKQIPDENLKITRLTLKEDLESGRVLTVVGDDNARAANDLSGLALTVDLGETGPLTKDLGVRDLDELDTVLSAESLDELEVLGFNAKVSIPCARRETGN